MPIKVNLDLIEISDLDITYTTPNHFYDLKAIKVISSQVNIR